MHLVGLIMRIYHAARSPERLKPYSLVADTRTLNITKFLLAFCLLLISLLFDDQLLFSLH